MPAPRISQKLLPGRKGRNTTNSKEGFEIDPNKLGQITLNRDAIQALTLANARVQVTISAGGTTAILVSEGDGKQIGGLDDLSKLLGLRSFVSKEKKHSASSDLQESILTAAFRASQFVKTKDTDFSQGKLDNSFVLAARQYKLLAETIESRQKVIVENYHEGSSGFDQALKFYCAGIGRAVQSTLAAMVKGEKEKGKLESFLFDEGVPIFIKNKLSMKSLAINKDTDLSRVFFSQDPSKGLALSVKEWRDVAFLKKQGNLVKNSLFLAKILQNDSLVQELTGLTAEQWSNAEDPKVQRVLKTRILVIPPFGDLNRVLEPLSRPNFRGFGLPATAMDQSKDRLANLCAVFIRAYAVSVRMAETIPDFYDRFTPKGTIKPPDEKLGNYAKQLVDAAGKGVNIDLIDILSGEKESTSLMEWIDRECKIIPNGDLHKKIAAVLKISDSKTPDSYGISSGEPNLTIRAKLYDMVSPVSTGIEKDGLATFKKDALSLKEKSVKIGKKSIASSVLKRETRVFLKHIARDHSPALSGAMESYFRGFYSEDIQSAAVRIAEARFDEMDELSELGSSEDDSSDEEDVDE